jgi:hypothetical protein
MRGEFYVTSQEVFLWVNVDSVKEAVRSPVFNAMDQESMDQARAVARTAAGPVPRRVQFVGVAAR